MKKLFALILLLLLSVSLMGQIDGTGKIGGTGKISKAAAAAGTPLLTGQTLGTLRNNFDGCVGWWFRTTASPPTIVALGRWVVSGNSQTHLVTLIKSNGTIIATVNVNTSGAPVGDWKREDVTPVALEAITDYYLLSHEVNGGDQWYEHDTIITVDGSFLNTTSAPPASALATAADCNSDKSSITNNRAFVTTQAWAQ